MHHNTPSPLPRAALDAVERGWRVFPLVPNNKRPAVRSWEPRATADAERVGRCWSAGDFNIGIATGRSRLVVIDLDVPKQERDVPPAGVPTGVRDGADMLAVLAEEHGRRFPTETYTVRSVSGGMHLYFIAPAEVELRNTAGALGWKIDTRAHGGYIVGAGSLIGGTPYSVIHDAPPAPLPEWLAELLSPAPLPPQRPVAVPLASVNRHDAYLRSAVDGELQRVSRAGEGNRNNALYQAAVALGQLVAGRQLDAAEVTEWLAAAAVGVGLAELDARRTVASGLRAGAKRPRTVRGWRAA
ncbi:bifunctional DNA primase/polymerase [Streptomyces griseocarneus]|uniref:bifunctional DNA primase/polymerase n=1 Tax=Streptomyces griseocarneus TaxID=51201 RepID=UPI00167CF66A|nr:bifunctional DNA primase/polymerase [Streptomyces griseocarneus]MBZ6473221.1 bifunctional DNA primase/polymerase [Streptomyces griseocarneus]